MDESAKVRFRSTPTGRSAHLSEQKLMATACDGPPDAKRFGSTARILISEPMAGLTSRQCAVLLACYSLCHASVRAIARLLRVSRPSVARSINVLAERGLVERSVDPTDQRGIVAI